MFGIDETLRPKLVELKAELRLYMNGAAAACMREKGLNYRVNFGVELPRLKEIAARHEKDHALAQALWREEVRESKILAALLQPVDTFTPDLAELWVDTLPTTEIAELTSMLLFQHLTYAPSLSFRWIADERPLARICGFRVIARLLSRRGDMESRVANELVDQAIATFVPGSLSERSAVMAALRTFIAHSDDHAYLVCDRVHPMKQSTIEGERLLFQAVEAELEEPPFR